MLNVCKRYSVALLAQEYPPLLPVLGGRSPEVDVSHGNVDGVLDLCECVNYSGGGAGSAEENDELNAFVERIGRFAGAMDCEAP